MHGDKKNGANREAKAEQNTVKTEDQLLKVKQKYAEKIKIF